MRFIIGLILCLSVSHLAHSIENKKTDNETWVYMVSNGDNLWNIASKFLKKIDYYSDLQKLNNIKYPKRMNPGTVIRIPMEWIKHSPASAKVSFLEGANEFLRNNTLFPLTLETKLVLGDEIRIGNNASATIVFADGSEMVLFKNTIVSFDHLTSYGKTGMVDTRIRVIQGKVETNAKKNKGPGSRLDISTPSAISSVRGTQYRVSNNANNISTVEVIEGKVNVAGEAPEHSINVKAGEGTRIEKGEKPSKPVKLLPPPEITSKSTLFETTPNIRWLAVQGAVSYNVQLSQTENFKSILWQQQLSDTQITLPNVIPDGVNYYRITAIDNLGIEGFPSKSQFTLNLLPLAPKKNITPVRILDSSEESTLSWIPQKLTHDYTYIVEIASSDSFDNVLINAATQQTTFQIPKTLPFGHYFWRISTQLNEDIGPASNSTAFHWKTNIQSPNCFVDETPNTIDISWSVLAPKQQIIVQVAKDSQFSEVLEQYNFDKNTTNIKYTFDNNELFVRCKITLPEASIKSKWSDVQHISQIDEGIMSVFGFILLVILI